MASITVRVPPVFTAGTTLSVYVDRVGDVVPQGPPLETVVVGSDSMVTIPNLDGDRAYQVGATVAGRWVGFLVEPALDVPTTPAETIAALLAHEAAQTNVHGIPDTAQLYNKSEVDALIAGVGAPNVQTANYTLALADAGKAVEMNAAGATVVTVPLNSAVAFAVGTIIEIARLGAGAVTIHPPAGVVIRNRIDTAGTADRVIADQCSSVSLRKRATDEWLLVGDLA